MIDRDDQPLPRLADSMPSLFSRAEAEYRSNLDEPRAWQRLQERLATPPQSNSVKTRVWLLTAAAAACVVLGWAGWRAGVGQFLTSRARPTATVAISRTAKAETSIRLGEGGSTLPDGTAVELADGAEGTYRAADAHDTLELNRGKLKIKVAHQPPGHQFVVRALSYEFVVLGTQFAVGITDSRVSLDVTEGRVAVHDATHLLRVVERGEHWANDALSPSELAPVPALSSKGVVASPTPKPETPTNEGHENPNDPSVCRDLLRDGSAKAAEHCYLTIAGGVGLSAEMSLFEVARLRRDVMGQPAAALSALDDYQARFPSGTLAPEVRAARVDLLARSGRVDDALNESSQLLATSGGRARSVELRLLRGNLLRDHKHDCAAAVLEYQLIESNPGPRGDQAQYSRAKCLQQLGRVGEAIQAYKAYLTRSRPQQANAARKSLAELQP